MTLIDKAQTMLYYLDDLILQCTYNEDFLKFLQKRDMAGFFILKLVY